MGLGFGRWVFTLKEEEVWDFGEEEMGGEFVCIGE